MSFRQLHTFIEKQTHNKYTYILLINVCFQLTVLFCLQVLHVSVFVQSDGNYAAHVKVPSLQDAQYAISQLHRRKVGYKRILISYANSGGPSPQLIRYIRLIT
jgi:hypothetical protein